MGKAWVTALYILAIFVGVQVGARVGASLFSATTATPAAT
jgi:hypothetical protein